jgi:hypothetical protein
MTELRRRLMLGSHDLHQATVKEFVRIVLQTCGEAGENTVALLGSICDQMFEAGRIKGTVVYGGDHVEGHKLQGDHPMVDDHSIHARDITNAQVGQTLTNCNNIIQQQPAGEKKILLDQLQTEVKTILDNLPQDKKDKESEIADYLKAIVEQSTGKATANRRFYSVSAEGLLEASKWCKDFAGNIFGTIGQLGKMLWPDFSFPKPG